MMRLFHCCVQTEKTRLIPRPDFLSVPEADKREICAMYELSLFHSYYHLWQSNPGTFSADILQNGTTAEEAIRNFAARIAQLTIKEWGDDNLTSVIAYETNGTKRTIVGFALFGHDNEAKTEQDESANYLYYIGVAPTHFQNGIGSRLMSAMLEHCRKAAARENKVVSIKLHTRVFNIPAIRLYEKFGFQVLANDVTHGHSDKYFCYQYQSTHQLKIEPVNRRQVSRTAM